MTRRMIGIALIVFGDVLLIVSLAADPLGIGDGIRIGYKQITGAVMSMFVQLVGIVVSQVESKAKGLTG